ncbi:MAG: hypothetical protein ACJ790_07920 [Myxococcaceae bacterium]
MNRVLAAFGLCLLLWSPAARAGDDDDDSSDTSETQATTESTLPSAEALAAKLSPQRFIFVGAAGALVLGAAMDYWAQGQSIAASKFSSARESRSQLQAAQATADAANVMYGLAAAAVIYGIALELLPEPVAQKASLTFHF